VSTEDSDGRDGERRAEVGTDLCAAHGHDYRVVDTRAWPFAEVESPIEVVCRRECGAGPWPVGTSATDVRARFLPGHCGQCGAIHEGRVHCARNGCLYVHPEGRSQVAASAALDVCGPCEQAVDEELGKNRPEAVAEVPSSTGPLPLLVRFYDGDTLMYQEVRGDDGDDLTEEAAMDAFGGIALLRPGGWDLLSDSRRERATRYRLSGDRERNVATYRAVAE
jgi:hypothetical protein